MTDQTLAIVEALAALGHRTRFSVIVYLWESRGKFGAKGPTAAEIHNEILGKRRRKSRMSFHLRKLREAGLVTARRDGKYLRYEMNEDLMRMLSSNLYELTRARPPKLDDEAD